MKESFLIYKSFYPAIEDLSNEQLGKLFRAIFEYQISEIDCTDPDIVMAFKFFKNQFRLDAVKYEKVVNRNRANGLNGGRPKTEDNPENPVGLSKPKKADNDNDNGKGNVKENDIESRKLKFASALKPFIDKFGKTMLNDFYRYWTEPNKSNTKFRYELEKTWDLERRLDTWAKKDSTFTKGANFQQKPDTLKNINIDDIKY